MELNEISGAVIDSSLKVHTQLGPGLLEGVYEICLAHELRKRGIKVRTQVPVPVHYDGINLDAGYRLDLLIEDVVFVEVKAVEQLLSYLKLSNLSLGLLLNFNVVHMREGWKRVVNNFKSLASSASSAV